MKQSGKHKCCELKTKKELYMCTETENMCAVAQWYLLVGKS